MLEKFRSVICWANFWIGFFLIGSARLYSHLHDVPFLAGFEKGIINVYCPAPTVAVLVSMGAMLLTMGSYYMLFHYVHVLAIVLVRKPIRV